MGVGTFDCLTIFPNQEIYALNKYAYNVTGVYTNTCLVKKLLSVSRELIFNNDGVSNKEIFIDSNKFWYQEKNRYGSLNLRFVT